MPELPEVETVRLQMEKELVGDVIDSVQVRQRMVFPGDENELVGKKIVSIVRWGKYLFVYFEDSSGIQIHLKMTGRLVLDDEWYQEAEHTRVVMTLVSGRKLYYWDTRMFGYLRPEKALKEAEQNLKKKMGPDPWEINEIELMRRFQKTRRSVKDTILDQSILAGVGNIYANDALFLAGIDPRRGANTIKLSEARKLIEAIRSTMERGLELGGASDNTYRNLYGKKGGYQNEFLVYGKTGGTCPKCGRKLVYEKISGRGSWYCGSCQK